MPTKKTSRRAKPRTARPSLERQRAAALERAPLEVAMEKGRFDPSKPYRTCGTCGAVFQPSAAEVEAARSRAEVAAGGPVLQTTEAWYSDALAPILSDHYSDTDGSAACVPSAPAFDDEAAVAYA